MDMVLELLKDKTATKVTVFYFRSIVFPDIHFIEFHMFLAVYMCVFVQVASDFWFVFLC